MIAVNEDFLLYSEYTKVGGKLASDYNNTREIIQAIADRGGTIQVQEHMDIEVNVVTIENVFEKFAICRKELVTTFGIIEVPYTLMFSDIISHEVKINGRGINTERVVFTDLKLEERTQLEVSPTW